MLENYFRCTLFDKKEINFSNDSYVQQELLLQSFNEKATFKINNILYTFKYYENKTFNVDKPTILLPIKDNIKLLEYTLSNLKKYKIIDLTNVLIIDDRSHQDLYNISQTYEVSYLRIDNPKGFNFSTINNIAAKIMYDRNIKQIILWNSDLWANDENTLPNLLHFHNSSKATITGTKLVYPTFDWNDEESHTIKSVFPDKINTYKGTIQFAGSNLKYDLNTQNYTSHHDFRFKDPDYIYANTFYPCHFITGAFLIIDLKFFINCGGLNPSLAKNYQDLDLCLKTIEQNKLIMYNGENKYFIHGESITISKNRYDEQFSSDFILFNKLWPYQKILKEIFKQ